MLFGSSGWLKSRDIKDVECWLISLALVLFSGIASGLTVGLLSLDPVRLRVLEEEETSEEQKRKYRRVAKVVQRHHLLLVTLLLANALAMEALPIFLDQLLPSWAAVLLSVTAILVFGEILPQALCTGRYQLAIAEIATPFVHLLIAVFFVVSWPMSKLLDKLFGNDHTEYYARAHLKALIRMHERHERLKSSCGDHLSDHAGSALGRDEVVVIEGALDMANKSLGEIMLPLERVFMLEAETVLTRDVLQIILDSGHSRVPVYEKTKHNLVGLLLTKSLLSVDPIDGKLLAKDLIVDRRPIFAHPDSNLYDLLNEFQKGHWHIAFVTEHVDAYTTNFKTRQPLSADAQLLGIATLEDVIEELIQEEIYDEFDGSVKQHENIGRPASGSFATRRNARTPLIGGPSASIGGNMASIGAEKKYGPMALPPNAFTSSVVVPLVATSNSNSNKLEESTAGPAPLRSARRASFRGGAQQPRVNCTS